MTEDVTHELRTPLTTLQSHIEAMIDGVLEANPEHLMSIHEEIIRLGYIVKDLEHLSRYDSKSSDLKLEKINLSHCITKIINIYEAQFRKKQVSLIFNKKDIFLNVDKDKMSQVFINLLSNALKYTPTSGEVVINMKTTLNKVIIEIKDNGVGIDKEDMPFIFERFYRADKSRNRQTGGSGIGLAIVKSIIMAHEGKVYAQSEVGKGTNLIIELPRKEEK